MAAEERMRYAGKAAVAFGQRAIWENIGALSF